MVSLIKELEERYALNTTPDVATTVAQSLIQLSSGIYTEEERFIFELLQNAVDAHDLNAKCLNIKIVLKDNYLIFMHNGEPFSERDIKGLCDIGNGNKTKDVKKIGYKGIGFKSVFMRSTCVTVDTGNYCFKFDKSHWDNYWEKNWKAEYGNKDSEKKYLMPWQIIPIETTPAIQVNKVGYNVVTYIQLHKSKNIAEKIEKLLASSQFLLFLKASNIRITFEQDNIAIRTIEKSTQNNKVSLFSNGQIENLWLIYSNGEVPVPDNVREEINADTSTPEKLKDAKTFDLSFAIALSSDGKLKRVDKKDAVIYTYLPTSFKFGTEGLPFLVNANFITDAGRQQLHKDSEWNKMIFSKIPFEFLKWVASISTLYANYYDILPKTTYGSENALEEVHAKEMRNAIEQIKFIPQLNNPSQKLLAKEAIMDRMKVAEVISETKLVAHINRIYAKSFDEFRFIAPVWKGYKIFEEYGVFVFGKNNIKRFLEDEQLFDGITIDGNKKIIDFLYNLQSKNPEDANEINTILKETKFLLDENLSLKKPSDLYFYTNYKNENSLATDVPLLHGDINYFVEDNELDDWLSKLGVQTLSNISFVEYLYRNDNYITEENAIEIGRFIFQIYQEEALFEEISSYKLQCVKFLSKQGVLKSAKELYLGERYKPELNVEPIFTEDIFVSEEYCLNSSAAEWKVFFLKMGVKEDIANDESFVRNSDADLEHRFDKVFFDNVIKTAKKYGWVSYDGWYVNRGYGFGVSSICYSTFSFLNRCDSYSYSKLIFSRILSKYTPEEIATNVRYVDGATGFIQRVLGVSYLTDLGCDINHFKWIIDNSTIIPTSKKICFKATEVYSNSIPNIKELAGDYLPILDVDCEITDVWQEYLGLKKRLELEDYLFLLTEIANNIKSAEENKDRISMVYQKMVEQGCLDSNSDKMRIKEWAKECKLLSRDYSFKSPSELSHITLDGFGLDNRVYIGHPSNRNKVIELLELMGVKIITENNIHPDFSNTEKDNTELKNILVHWLSPLALIAAGENPTEEEYTKAKEQIKKKLLESHFYHCETIKLTYGNSDDVIDRHTFAQGNDFYYIGNLRPANVEPLLSPLCKYLGISKKERELFIILIEDFDGIRQNLKDKGYSVELLEEPKEEPSETIVTSIGGGRSISQQERDRITGFKGEILVYERLKSFGYTPISQTISENDFEGSTTISMFGKTYYCEDNFNRYDMYFENRNGVKIFVEVKSTTWNKGSQENMPISYNELSMIEDYQYNEKEKYVIMRVFGINQDKQDIYLFEGQIIDVNPFENL